jgi:hypothetical protein
MTEALRDCDQERLVALCRDHLLPSRDAYLEQQRRRVGGAMTPAPAQGTAPTLAADDAPTIPVVNSPG